MVKIVPSYHDDALQEIAGKGLFIKLMGAFEVYKDGRPIATSAWKRHASRDLLVLLAIFPHHSITRARAIELLWPETDFVTGRSRLYTTLTGLRTALGQTDEETYILCPQGKIGLNMHSVVCDIDLFEDAAQKIHRIVHPTDERVLSLCYQIEDLFCHGCFEQMEHFSSELLTLEQYLQARFVDSMVKACEFALQFKNIAAAEHFALLAYRFEPTRDDVVLAAMKSHVAANREQEAIKIYQDYVLTLIEQDIAPAKTIKLFYQTICHKQHARKQDMCQENDFILQDIPKNKRVQKRSFDASFDKTDRLKLLQFLEKEMA